ncbi:MAG: phenylalanine--tRNA ligase subunit beta [Acidobacteriota bacterium]|nr:phenylalanine--tRNA ligase subunit beta [Acidobacteriota bacterium]
MRVPLRWLEAMVPLPEDVEALAHRLTLAGLEVTDIERTGGDWDRVVVGRVLEVRPHPDADRLRLVTVDKGGEHQTVVCGASNVAAGQDIAFAPEGAMLTDPRTGTPRKLKKSRIRGVVSGGMVCSEAELGLSAEHEGILVLDTSRPPGTPLHDVLGDRVYVFDLTPNRADALCVLGVAREVSALTGAPLTPPEISTPRPGPAIEGRASVEIADPDLCRRFTLALIEDVEIAPSPAWMQERLTAAGMRPINNLVDITNYVMLELGQPVHAFDYDTVRDGHIIVRRAAPGETLTTLDGKTRQLDPDRLVIADPGGAIALAGVMGGLETEITDSTRNVLLEVANFEPAGVRRTARAFDLLSDAARRFAWGLPPEMPQVASARVCRLLAEYAGGRVAAGMVDSWPMREPGVTIRLRRSRIPQVLGMEIPPPAVRAALDGLGFEVEEADGTLTVGVPYWRRDVRVPDDLVEEVARIAGYDDLPAAPLAGAIPHHPPLPARELRERVRDLAAEAALYEVQTYSLLSDADLRAVTPAELRDAPLLKVRNPLGEARDTLRTSLRPGILRAAARNVARGARTVRLFEVGRSYHPASDSADGRPEEREAAVGLVVGVRLDRYGSPTEAGLDFFDAKATLEHVLAGLRVNPDFRPAAAFGLLEGRTAEVSVAGSAVGVLGQVHPETAAVFGVGQDAFLWELDLSALLEAAPGMTEPPAAVPLPRHPSAIEDFALLVGPDVLAQNLVREALGHPLVVEARVFDDYLLEDSDAPGEGEGARRSLGISVRYQARNRTLNENDIAKVRRTILKRFKANHGAVVRERA